MHNDMNREIRRIRNGPDLVPFERFLLNADGRRVLIWILLKAPPTPHLNPSLGLSAPFRVNRAKEESKNCN